MAGGIFEAQDKVRAGGYVNFEEGAIEELDLSSGDLMTLPVELGFGPEQVVVPVSKTVNLAQFGYKLTDKQMLLVNEAFKRAKVILLYRLNKGTKAQATSGSLAIEAKYSGAKGNDISVVSKQNVDDPTRFNVEIYNSGKLIQMQSGETIEDLTGNEYITFSGSGALTAFDTTLSGGTDGTVTAADYAAYFEAIQVYDFAYMALPTEDNAIKKAAVSFVERLRDEEGKKCQLVASGIDADHEAVINVKNGVVLEDGTEISAAQATAWVAGASATIGLGKSLTQQAYDGATDVLPRLTSSEIISALYRGEFLFTPLRGEARVEKDINSLHTFTENKKNVWSKNEAVRTFDYIANDSRITFEDNYIGKVANNSEGREAFRADRIVFFEELQGQEAIQNFDKNSVQVAAGEQPDAMVLTVDVKVLNTLEKLYMTVTVK